MIESPRAISTRCSCCGRTASSASIRARCARSRWRRRSIPSRRFTSCPSCREGERIAGPAVAQRWRLEGGALVAAQLFGIAEATQELATAYAKTREQFGRSIGSFQAIKHILADTFVRQELARAAAYAAGATLDHPEVGEPARAVSSAKVVAGDAALANSRACIQVHGGMGYTWEMPCHYYLKRTWVLAGLFGSGEEHSERLARQVAAAL